MIINQPLSLSILNTSHKGGILNTTTCITETRYRAVVGPTSELLLHGLGEKRTLNKRVLRGFGGKFAVEVGGIQGINLRLLD